MECFSICNILNFQLSFFTRKQYSIRKNTAYSIFFHLKTTGITLMQTKEQDKPYELSRWMELIL